MLKGVDWLDAAAVALAAFVAFLLLNAAGFRFDPFDWTAKRAVHAETSAEAYADAGVARELEVEAERSLAAEIHARGRTLSLIEEKTDALDRAAAADPAAATPLPPGVADRLREHDDFLCELRPLVCVAGPAAEPAPGGGARGGT
jgi:hypothetical protein